MWFLSVVFVFSRMSDIVPFCVWLLSLSIILLEVHPCSLLRFIAEYYSTYLYNNWYIHLSVGERLDCFQFCAVINKAAKTFCIWISQFYRHTFSFLLGKYLGLGLLGHIISVCKTDWQFLTKCTYHFCIPPNNIWDCELSLILTSTWYYQTTLILAILVSV